MNVVIYTKENCSFCTQAKMHLLSRNIPYTELRLGVDFSREQLKEIYSTATTYPVIVVDGMYIGGFTELAKYLAEQVDNDNRKFLVE